MKRLLTVIGILLLLFVIAKCFSGRLMKTIDERIDDNITGEYVKKQEFIIFRCDENFYYANSEDIREIYFSNKLTSPELENGEFASITGDAEILNGGICGFHNATSIEKIRSFEKLSLDDAIDKLNLQELSKQSFTHKREIVKYTSGNDVYIIFDDYGTYEIFKNSKYIKTAYHLDEYDIDYVYRWIETSDNAE